MRECNGRPLPGRHTHATSVSTVPPCLLTRRKPGSPFGCERAPAAASTYNDVMEQRRGFTLVEVLAAILILAIVVTTSMAAFLERNRRLQQASEIMLASQALANESEFRRRTPYAGLENEPETFVSDTALLATLAPYTTHVTVEQTQPGVKNVTLEIRWREGARSARLGLVRVDTGGTPLW